MVKAMVAGLSSWLSLTDSLRLRWGTGVRVDWQSRLTGVRLVRRDKRYVRFVSAAEEVFMGSTEPKATFRFGGLRLRRAAGAAK